MTQPSELIKEIYKIPTQSFIKSSRLVKLDHIIKVIKKYQKNRIDIKVIGSPPKGCGRVSDKGVKSQIEIKPDTKKLNHSATLF